MYSKKQEAELFFNRPVAIETVKNLVTAYLADIPNLIAIHIIISILIKLFSFYVLIFLSLHLQAPQLIPIHNPVAAWQD